MQFPLISTLVSKTLFMYIKVLILLISCTYRCISKYLSFVLIQKHPSIYPAGYSTRIRLVWLAPACSGWIALRKQLCLSIHTSGANPGTGPGSLATEHLSTTVTPGLPGWRQDGVVQPCWAKRRRPQPSVVVVPSHLRG
jgi:hypothetical protein